MNERKGKSLKIIPLFLLGQRPSFLREDRLGFRDIKDESEHNAKTDEILQQLDVDTEPKILVKKEEDLDQLIVDADVFIIFAHSIRRFPGLITLADTGVPIIIASEEGAGGEALDTYEYLAEYENVRVAFSFEEIRRRIRTLKAVKQIRATRICAFDRGEHSLDGVAWYKNPLLKNKFKTEYVDISDFENRYQNVDRAEARDLAEKWMNESKVMEPSLEDVVKSAALYIAMKEIIENLEADAAYVLWCAQFDKLFSTKLCFAIAKLNDAGHLTGCWRGENLLPMLILHRLSDKPVFFGEVHTYRDGIISLRHCAVPTSIVASPPILRRWRDREGTVTGYCELPKGDVTLVNSGTGDRMVVMRGSVVDCRDLEGDNCRTTVWIRLEDKTLIRAITGREFAMVYGDYAWEAEEVGRMLGLCPGSSLQ